MAIYFLRPVTSTDYQSIRKKNRMKNLLPILLMAATLWACKNTRHSENEAQHVLSVPDYHQPESEKLVLNNGAKWKTDNTTNFNVSNLKAIVEKFNHGTKPSLQQYSKVAEELQHGLDKLISECKMHGAEHTALHQWLEPFIKEVIQLKAASTLTDASGS